MILYEILLYFCNPHKQKPTGMSNKFIDTVFYVVKTGHEMGISHQTLGDEKFHGGEMHLDTGQKFINFSLCDYLAISTDERIKQAAIKSIEKNGVYTAVSRTYMKLHAYEEAEDIVSKIFNKPVIITPRTTLAHISALPIIVEREDAVILDHQVHTSVRLASEILRASGVHTELLRHNNMNRLEDRIIELKDKHRRIWYLADGVYSMYGDTIPGNEVKALMDKYEQFYCYVDDAHGMSWRGENGKGLFLDTTEYHPQFFLTTSLGKGFGAGGGAIICPDEKIRERIAFTGAPIMFTSPTEPATLGSIIASAKIHLSPEIKERQLKLKSHFEYFYGLANELNIPILSNVETPIVFIATGIPEMTAEMCQILLGKGFHLTSGTYPAVPYNNSGVRGIINLYQTKDDIKNMLHTFKEEYDKILVKYKTTQADILKHYRL